MDEACRTYGEKINAYWSLMRKCEVNLGLDLKIILK
jgi:hypothetical protein